MTGPAWLRDTEFPSHRACLLTALVLGVVTLTACAPGMLAAPTPIHGHAILFGASDYEPYGQGNSGPDLPAVANDVDAMAMLLESQGWAIQVYRDAATSLSALGSALEAIPAEERKSLPLLFYYAGHGGWKGDRWWTDDMPTQMLVPGAAYTATGFRIDQLIGPAELQSLFSGLEVRYPVVILDSCFSGGFLPPSPGVDPTEDDYMPGTYRTEITDGPEPGFFPIWSELAAGSVSAWYTYDSDPGYFLIAAAGAAEESKEDTSNSTKEYYGHGIFTYYMLRSSEETTADLDRDGYISASELFRFTSTKLEAAYNRQPGNRYAAYLPRISGRLREPLLFRVRSP